MPKQITPFWLVWREDGDAPRARHKTPEKAKAEAERLARASPGQNFYVLQPISMTAKSDIVTVDFWHDEIPF